MTLHKSYIHYKLNRAEQVVLVRLRRAQQTERTLVQQDEDRRTVGHVPLATPLSNDQCDSPPALPAPGHHAADHLARGSAPDGEAVRGPSSPKEDGSICEVFSSSRGDRGNKREEADVIFSGWAGSFRTLIGYTN